MRHILQRELDIAVFDARGALVAGVDVLASSQLSRADAAKYVEAMAPDVLREARFMMLIGLEKMWLWVRPDKTEASEVRERDLIEAELPPYLKQKLKSLTVPIDDHFLRLLAYQWLIRVREFDTDRQDVPELFKTILSAILNARIELGDAA